MVVVVTVRAFSASALLVVLGSRGGAMTEEKPSEKSARNRRRTVRRVDEIGAAGLPVAAAVVGVGVVVVVEPFGSMVACSGGRGVALPEASSLDDVLHETVRVRRDVLNVLFSGLR